MILELEGVLKTCGSTSGNISLENFATLMSHLCVSGEVWMAVIHINNINISVYILDVRMG